MPRDRRGPWLEGADLSGPCPILVVRAWGRRWSVRLVGQGALFGRDVVGAEVARCRSRRLARDWALERAGTGSGVVVTPAGRTFEVECSAHGMVSRHQTTEAYAVERAVSHLQERHG